MGNNDLFQPPSAGAQDQDKKRPFRRWMIAVVVVLLIASIGGFYLHWSSTYPELYASYSGGLAVFACSPPDAMGGTGSLSLHYIVEDHTHGTFITGLISQDDGCGSVCSGTARGAVTPDGEVRFSYVQGSDYPLGCGDGVSFSGTIQSKQLFGPSEGEIDGGMYYDGTSRAGNFAIAPSAG